MMRDKSKISPQFRADTKKAGMIIFFDKINVRKEKPKTQKKNSNQ